MACRVGAVITKSSLFVVENEVFERSSVALTTCSIPSWNNEASSSNQASKIGFHVNSVHFSKQKYSSPSLHQMKRASWKIAFALNTGGISGNGQQEGLNGDNSGLGGTRLGRIVSAGGRQLLQKLNSSRKNIPMKIFLLLLGFYTANALATILGQTGDWDVLVAGVVVAAIEGIGMLMYRKPRSFTSKRFQSFVSMMNYWKAGVCLGLFVDAFKLGS